MFKISVDHYRIVDIDGGKFLLYVNRKNPRGSGRFLPNGGTTDVVIYENDKKIGQGTAICSKKDNFCYKTGYTIALERALKDAGIKVTYTHERLPNKKPPKRYDDLSARFFGKEWDICDGWKYPEPPSPKGGRTKCYFVRDGVIIARGETRCSVKDNFCRKIGREIAYKRALAKFLS